VFGAVTVLPAMLAAAWLLPALPLVLTGRFEALPMVFMFAPLAVGLCYFAVRQLPVTWPGFRPHRPAAQTQPAQGQPALSQPALSQDPQARGQHAAVPWWAVVATIAVAVAFAVWQIAERTEQIIFLRDPSTYLEVGYWIAHHGSLPIPDSLAAFGGSHPGLGFASVNYYPRGSGIVPQFMTGMPAVIAAAVWLGGIPAALVVTPLIGGCAVLSFGGLAGRLAGPKWAPAAAAVLALSLPEQYTSRSTFSEPLAQVLLFGGLCLLIDSLVINRGQGNRGQNSGNPDDRDQSRPADRTSGFPAQDKMLAALAGLALGITIFVRIDGLSDILPAVPFLGVLVAARRRQALPFGIGLVIGVGYGLADGYLLSRPYLDLEGPSLKPLALITVLLVLLTVAGVAVTKSRAARARFSGWLTAARLTQWLPLAAAVVTVLIFIGFAVRPLVQTVAGETDPTSIAYVAELQKLAGMPINGRRQYYEQSLYWVIWYLGLPAVLLGAFGLAVLARRGVRSLLTWHDPRAAARVWALPLLIAIWVIVTVLWRPAVAPDQPWASRRLVPFVLPGIILGAIWASAWLRERASRPRPAELKPAQQKQKPIPAQLSTAQLNAAEQSTAEQSTAEQSTAEPKADPAQKKTTQPKAAEPKAAEPIPGQRTASRPRLTPALVAVCCVASLIIPTALTTLDIGFSAGPNRHLSAHGMAFRKIGAGELTAVTKLCAAIGPDASVVIVDSLTADRFAQVVRGICGTPAAVLTNPSQATVGAVVTGIDSAGRRPVLLAEQQAELADYGGTSSEVVNLLTTQEAHNLTAPPTRTWLIHYTVWLSRPTSAPAGGAAA
jgi:hypothetical protein